MVLWFYGFMVLWFYGFMVLAWFYGLMVLLVRAWKGPTVFAWLRNGATTEERCAVVFCFLQTPNIKHQTPNIKHQTPKHSQVKSNPSYIFILLPPLTLPTSASIPL